MAKVNISEEAVVIVKNETRNTAIKIREDVNKMDNEIKDYFGDWNDDNVKKYIEVHEEIKKKMDDICNLLFMYDQYLDKQIKFIYEYLDL